MTFIKSFSTFTLLINRSIKFKHQMEKTQTFKNIDDFIDYYESISYKEQLEYLASLFDIDKYFRNEVKSSFNDAIFELLEEKPTIVFVNIYESYQKRLGTEITSEFFFEWNEKLYLFNFKHTEYEAEELFLSGKEEDFEIMLYITIHPYTKIFIEVIENVRVKQGESMMLVETKHYEKIEYTATFTDGNGEKYQRKFTKENIKAIASN